MKQGSREKIFRLVWNSFFLFFNQTFEEKLIKEIKNFSWFEIFFILNTNIYYLSPSFQLSWSNFETVDEKSLLFDHLFLNNDKEINQNYFIKNFMYTRLVQLMPLFGYFIYNVDKNIRKYTRGKSGKYIFVWKYVAPYKRKYSAFRSFLKEIKFDEQRRFTDRLQNLFYNLTFNLTNTHAWRSKNFTYTFIFKNFRKTLMTTLRTLTQS